MKPERWADPANKLFPYQVGFTSPPHDFDAAPSDFLRIAPESVGAHGRMLHVPEYAHELKQRTKNFHLLEEVVECMKLLAETEGIFTETAGGVTLGVLKKLIGQGRIQKDEVTVLCITGNGLKTQEALEGHFEAPTVIEPNLNKFEELFANSITV